MATRIKYVDEWYRENSFLFDLKTCYGIDIVASLNDLLERYDRQERLGKEFEDVLYDNLWELYEVE